MAAPHSLDLDALVREHLEQASPDLLRELLKSFVEALMSAEAQVLCGADYGEVSAERTNHRNGYRPRDWDTRAGSIELAVSKLRSGSYFPDWLLQRRRRAEQALITVVAMSYVLGVSTRRVEKLCEALSIDKLSKSQVSEMAKSLDAQVAAFRNRPLDQGPYRFLWADALVVKVREQGRTQRLHVLVATAVNGDGHREILGLDVSSEEDGAGWTAFLRGLVARGLSGVALVISDAHEGLKGAIAAVLDGASWQRCRTHAMRNLLTRVPKSAQGLVATLVRTIFAQPDVTQVHAQFNRVVDQLQVQFPAVTELLLDAEVDLLAFSAFPPEHWRQIWSNNPQERLNREIRRRTDVVGIFPNRAACIRLVGAVLAEQHDEWLVARRYMSEESLAKTRVRVIAGGLVEKEVGTTVELEAVS